MEVNLWTNSVRSASTGKVSLETTKCLSGLSHFEDHALEIASDWAYRHGRKKGVVSEAIYHELGEVDFKTSNYIRFEAHMNTTSSTERFENEMLKLGFEPDDFILLHPECYSRNYTFCLDVDRDTRDIGRIRRNYLENCEAASRLLDEEPDVEGYLEAEIIPSKWIRTFTASDDDRVFDLDDVGSPLGDWKLDQFHIPRTQTESENVDFPLDVEKIIDLHIKVPGDIVRHPIAGAETSPRQKALETVIESLEAAGFYVIVSNTPNTILTAQFLDGGDARAVFERLVEFAERTGLFKSIILEPCVFFWRKKMQTPDGLLYSEVSPLVFLKRPESV